MADIATLSVLLSLRDQVSGGLQGAQQRLTAFGQQAGQVGRSLALLSAPMAGIGFLAIKAAGQFEQTTIAFETLLGSAEDGQRMLKDLADFATRTPFQLRDLERATTRLLAYGFAADDVLPMLRSVGDATAALGLGSEGIDRITRALGQMQAKGKVSAQEMMQLAEAGIPAWKLLADAIGLGIPEAMKLAEKGGIDAATAITAITAGMAAEFGGLMERQAQTLLGRISNIKDTLDLTLRDIGAPLIAVMGVILDAMEPLLQGLGEWVRRNPVLAAGIVAAGLAVAGLGVALITLGFVVPAIATSLGLLGGVMTFLVTGPFKLLVMGLGIVQTAFGLTRTAAIAMHIALGGPLLLILGLVAGAIAVFAVAWAKNWGGIRERTADAVNAIGPYLVKFVNYFTQVVLNNWVRGANLLILVVKTLGGLLAEHWETIIGAQKWWGERMVGILSAMFPVYALAAKSIIGAIRGIGKELDADQPETFLEKLSKALEGIADTPIPLIPPVTWEEVKAGAEEAFTAAGDKVTEFVTKAKALLAGLPAAAVPAVDALIAKFNDLTGTSLPSLSEMIETVRAAITEGMDAAGKAVAGLGPVAEDAIPPLVDLGDAGEDAGNRTANAFARARMELVALTSGAAGIRAAQGNTAFITAQLGEIMRAGAEAASAVGGAGWNIWQPSFPGLQHGGRVERGGWAMVGEAGPEALRLPRGATVAPLAAGGGNVTVNVTIEGNVDSEIDFQRAVGAALRDLRLRGAIA